MSIIRNGIFSADLDVPVVLPTLNLDFANSQSLDKRITFSRGSIGTRVNRNRLIETVSANLPRFDYDPVTGECRGLLIEESRSNSLLRSEDFTTTWGASAVSVSSNVITAPDGNTTADKLVENTSFSSFKFVSQSVGTIVGTYTVSAFFKAGERFSGYIQLLSSGGNATAGFNLRTGTIIGGSGTITPYGNGWYRVSSTATFTSATATVYIVLYNINGISNYTGDGTSGIYVWGAQLEAGAFPTSYIPTVASTVTRSVDIVEMTGTNFSSWYNQTEGTFFYNGTLPFITNDTVNRVPFGVSNGFNFSNSIYVAKTSTSLALGFSVINNNASQQSGAVGGNMTSTNFKIASAVAPRNIYTSLYGGIVKPSRPSAIIPPATRLTLGKEPWNTGVSNPIIGCINKFAYYPKALSPAELQYLTQ